MKTIICLLFLAVPVKASDFGLSSLRAGNIPVVPSAVPAAAQAPGAPQLKEWTIIALLNGKNSLTEAVADDINEMETVGSTPGMNIVVEAGTVSGAENEPPVFSVKRYLVQKDNDIHRVGSKVLMTLGKTDMGSWKHLADFIIWAKTNYPAKRYMVVVWNHGSGWKSPGKPITGDVEKGISFDDETGNNITAIEMGRALAKAGRADLFASDACLMQDIGVNYEIRKYVDVIAGSEESEPNEGQDYAAFLPQLAARPSATAEEAARMYVDAYASFYRTRNENTNISAVRAASLDGLVVKASALADALLAMDDIQFARDERRKTLKFADPDARDLGHFARVVAGDAKDPAVRLAAQGLYDYLKSEVVIASAFTKYKQPAPAKIPGLNGEPASAGDFANSTGLAAYIPVVYQDVFEYDQLSFAKASSWTALVKKMRSPKEAADYWDDYPDQD